MTGDVQTYRVADFCFEVEGMPFEPANLLPFKTEPNDAEKIFHLKVVSELPETDSTLLYRTPEDPRFHVITLYTQNNGYLVEFQSLPSNPVSGRMLVDASFRQAQIELSSHEKVFALDNAMKLLYTFSSAHLGALQIHSSVVIQDGKGYLFLGKSGTGKSTHSQLWLKHIPGTELLNDDFPVLRLLPDKSIRIYGSPWSGKTPCYKSQDAPVGAIVHLSQAPYNKIERVSVIRAYGSLLESCAAFRPLKSFADGWHRTMEGVCTTTPYYRLECLPNEEAALLCYQTVTNNSQI
ncbi:MAG: hypothetical protein J5490_05250 [Bacteroidales bacterium]|nr:hypothetical protein [Bacteroidales bacterium]